MKFGIGQPVARKEDPRLVTGRGRFAEDIARPGALHAAIVRAHVAHAHITGIEVGDALQMPGVKAVLTGREYRADGLGGISCRTLFPGLHAGAAAQPVPAIAIDRVRHAGMPVAIVVADSKGRARDAADRVAVEFKELPAVVDTREALAKDAPVLWENASRNVAFEIELGDKSATDRAIAAASHGMARLSW